MVSININDHHYELPASWEEVIAADQYLPVMRILMQDAGPMRDYELFKALTGFDITALDLTAAGREQLSGHLYTEIFPRLSFLYDPEQVFTINPIPAFTHDGVTYTGPKAKLNDQTGFAWEISYHLQTLFQQTGDNAHLEALIYRNYQGDSVPDQRTPLPAELVYGIYLWYGKCEQHWRRIYPWLFPDPGGDPAPDAEPPTGREIKELLFRLAGSKLNADYDIVRGRTRPDILFALDEMEKERERIEAARHASEV